MLINLSPVRMDRFLTASVFGDAITLNGVTHDFSALAEGETEPRGNREWLASDVTRVDGQIALTLILPHGADAPEEARFPQPIIATDGPVALPGPLNG